MSTAHSLRANPDRECTKTDPPHSICSLMKSQASCKFGEHSSCDVSTSSCVKFSFCVGLSIVLTIDVTPHSNNVASSEAPILVPLTAETQRFSLTLAIALEQSKLDLTAASSAAFCFSFSFLAARLARPLRLLFSPFFLLSGLPGGLLALLGGLGELYGALGGLFGACLGEAVFGLPGGLLSTMALMVRGARRQVCEAALVPCGLARWACPLVALV